VDKSSESGRSTAACLSFGWDGWSSERGLYHSFLLLAFSLSKMYFFCSFCIPCGGLFLIFQSDVLSTRPFSLAVPVEGGSDVASLGLGSGSNEPYFTCLGLYMDIFETIAVARWAGRDICSVFILIIPTYTCPRLSCGEIYFVNNSGSQTL
jgi:hypothetical protein